MKITASISGGFAGISESYQIDTTKNPSEAARSLESALEKIGFFEHKKALQPDLVGADMMRWTIEVSDGQRRNTVSFVEDGSAGISEWRNLIDKIKALA